MEQATRIQFKLNAEDDQRFTDQFAHSLIGQAPRINIRECEGGPIIRDLGAAVVVDAEVVDDGRAVLITYEMARGNELTSVLAAVDAVADYAMSVAYRPPDDGPNDDEWKPV